MRWPDDIRQRAIGMLAEGYSSAEVSGALTEAGYPVPAQTVRFWKPRKTKIYSSADQNADLHLWRDEIDPVDNPAEWRAMLHLGALRERNRQHVKLSNDRLKLAREEFEYKKTLAEIAAQSGEYSLAIRILNGLDKSD